MFFSVRCECTQKGRMAEFGAASSVCGGPYTDDFSDLRGGCVLCGQPQKPNVSKHFLASKNGRSSVQTGRWARVSASVCVLQKK